MKLIFSPSSPFVRKVRIAAIELGLIDKIEFLPTTVAPGQANDEYARITPLKKLPALILDNGDVILDSYVIAEYLDEPRGIYRVAAFVDGRLMACLFLGMAEAAPQWDTAKALFKQMRDELIQPNVVTYSTLINLAPDYDTATPTSFD